MVMAPISALSLSIGTIISERAPPRLAVPSAGSFMASSMRTMSFVRKMRSRAVPADGWNLPRWRTNSASPSGAPNSATGSKASLSYRHKMPNFASQMRTAFSSMAWKTGSSATGACRGILAHSIARRQSIPCRQRDDLIPMGERERAARNNQRTNSSWDKGFKRRLDFAGVRGTQNNELLPDCSRRNLHVFSVLGVVQRLEHANSRRRGHKLTQLLQSFRPYRGSEKAYACDVTARPI